MSGRGGSLIDSLVCRLMALDVEFDLLEPHVLLERLRRESERVDCFLRWSVQAMVLPTYIEERVTGFLGVEVDTRTVRDEREALTRHERALVAVVFEERGGACLAMP